MTDNVVSLKNRISPASKDYKYVLDDSFAKTAAYMLCVTPTLWRAVGKDIEPARLANPHVKEIVQACALIAKQLPPTTTEPVCQVLQNRVHAGKLSRKQFEEIVELFDEVSEKELPEEDTVRELLAQAVKAVRTKVWMDEAIARHSKGEDLTDHAEKYAAILKIGQSTVQESVSVKSETFWQEMAELRSSARLSTGVADLDMALEGGMPPKSLLVWAADTKVGKSAAMMQQCAVAVRRRKKCLYVCLEMGVLLSYSRFLACLLGVRHDEVKRGTELAQVKLADFLSHHSMDNFEMVYLPSGASVADLRQAINAAKKKLGGLDCLFVDYCDRMTGDSKDKNDYAAMKTVYDFMDKLAASEIDYVVTASQLRRQEGQKGPPGVGSLNDSHWKVRIAHTILTIYQPNPENVQERGFHVAANRHGPAGDTFEGVQSELAWMRIAPTPHLPRVV